MNILAHEQILCTFIKMVESFVDNDSAVVQTLCTTLARNLFKSPTTGIQVMIHQEGSREPSRQPETRDYFNVMALECSSVTAQTQVKYA